MRMSTIRPILFGLSFFVALMVVSVTTALAAGYPDHRYKSGLNEPYMWLAQMSLLLIFFCCLPWLYSKGHDDVDREFEEARRAQAALSRQK
jgi:hypothetical protein